VVSCFHNDFDLCDNDFVVDDNTVVSTTKSEKGTPRFSTNDAICDETRTTIEQPTRLASQLSLGEIPTSKFVQVIARPFNGFYSLQETSKVLTR